MTAVESRTSNDDDPDSRAQRHLFELAPTPMLLVDAKTHRVMDVNSAANVQYGYTRDEFLARRSDDILATHGSSTLKAGGLLEVTRHRRKDGSLIDVDVTATSIVVEGRERCLVVANDVTVQRRMETALRASEASFRQLFEDAADAIITADVDGKVLGANGMACRLTGYTVPELQALSLHDLYLESQQELAAEHLVLLQNGGPLLVERPLRRKDGTATLVEVSATRLPDGRLHGIVRGAGIRSEREPRTHQSLQLESLGQFTGGIAHDFNNLLTVILANAHVLAGSYTLQSTVPEELHDVIEAAQRGSEMVRRLLRFARQQPVELAPVALGALAKDLSRTLRRLLPEPIDVAVDCADAQLAVMADAGAIEQIVMNLATNARDAMPNGGSVQVSVRRDWLHEGQGACGESIVPGEYVTLSVTDTGIGLDEVTRRRMFEPFFTTKSSGKGTGLGLAMTCRLVQQHRGVIQVSSKVGHGTTVRISLPAMHAP
ncbi:MAG: ATP-binding protein [bacterium]